MTRQQALDAWRRLESSGFSGFFYVGEDLIGHFYLVVRNKLREPRLFSSEEDARKFAAPIANSYDPYWRDEWTKRYPCQHIDPDK